MSDIERLEEQREQALLQVMLAAQAVCQDAGKILHQQSTHCLVERQLIVRLQEAIASFSTINENYLVAVSGDEATSSTKEL